MRLAPLLVLLPIGLQGEPPAQFPPLGTGLAEADKATLQAQVDELAHRVAALKQQHAVPPMADRVADVEVYLEAVRRPLKYDERLYAPMFWVTVDAMDEEWQRARVNAKVDGNSIRVTTTNVTAMRVSFDPGLAPFPPGTRASLAIDGTSLRLPRVAGDRSLRAGLVKSGASWKLGELPSAGLRKRHGLQGPIDDAFMDGFVFVRPTGKPLSELLGSWEREQADYAIGEWVHFFRGEPRVKNDTDVAADDIANDNLALFGDPSSNAIYKRIASRLPIAWTADGVTVGTERFDANHAPVLIFPNPLNSRKYVVINSGLTFHDQSSNDMQSPKLADWAVVDITRPGNNYRYLPLYVETRGFFDEYWKLRR